MSVQKLIFWDIDGTLLHCGSDGRKALNRTFFELYNIKDAFESSDIGGAMDSMILMGIMKSHAIGQDQLPIIVRHYRKCWQMSWIIIKISVFYPAYRNYWKPSTIAITPKMPCLQQPSDRRYDKIELGGLGIFKLGGFGDEPGEKWDAAYACIREAEEVFDTVLPKDRIYLIGDSVYDILCAQKLGIKSIAVGTGWTDADSLLAYKPDHFFPDLSDTEQVLEAIDL